jgi:hypothetical protein
LHFVSKTWVSLQLFEPQASFCNRLKQALDLSKTLSGSENDFGATVLLNVKPSGQHLFHWGNYRREVKYPM